MAWTICPRQLGGNNIDNELLLYKNVNMQQVKYFRE